MIVTLVGRYLHVLWVWWRLLVITNDQAGPFKACLDKDQACFTLGSKCRQHIDPPRDGVDRGF